MRRFPIMGGPSLPWEMIEPHERLVRENHEQSLERLAARGGLDPAEALAVLDDRKWRRMDPSAALADLKARLAAWDDVALRTELVAERAKLAEATALLERIQVAAGPFADAAMTLLAKWTTEEKPR